jgi:hypothetical protein
MDQPARADTGGGSVNNPAWGLRTLDRFRSCTWSHFLKRAKPQLIDDDWSSDLLGELTTADARHWIQLVDALEQLTTTAAEAGLPLPEPLDVWAEWVVPVGRLSFETGRVVVTL